MVFKLWDELFICTLIPTLFFPKLYFMFFFLTTFLFLIFFFFTDTLSVSCSLLLLWISYHPFLIVSKMFGQKTLCSFLKYANNVIRSIGMNMNGMWTVHLIKLHILNWNCVIVLNPCLFQLGPRSIIFKSHNMKDEKNYSSLHTRTKMTSWVVNLMPKSIEFFNLLLYLIPIMSFLPWWNLSPLSKARLKLINLRHVVQIKTLSSSFWMTRSWIFWTLKNKPRLGLNIFTTSIHFSQRHLFVHFFKPYIKLLIFSK